MNLRNSLIGGAMSFAHLAGIGKAAGKKAKVRADDDQDDEKPDASDDDEDDKPVSKGKKAKGRAADDDMDDDDDKPDASDDDDDDKPDASDDDDDDKPDASDDDEDDKPVSKGKKAKASTAEYRRGVRAERKRCAAIFGHTSAARNLPAAASLAFNTGMSASAAINTLKAMGPASGGASADRSRRNPDLGSDPGQQDRSAGHGQSWGAALSKAGVTPSAKSGGWDAAADRARR